MVTMLSTGYAQAGRAQKSSPGGATLLIYICEITRTKMPKRNSGTEKVKQNTLTNAIDSGFAGVIFFNHLSVAGREIPPLV